MDDQAAADRTIRNFYGSLEAHNCKAAYALLLKPSEDAEGFCQFWSRLASVDLQSVEPMLAIEAGTIAPADGVPTTYFRVVFETKGVDISPLNDNGQNTRWIKVKRDSAGEWRIEGMASTP